METICFGPIENENQRSVDLYIVPESNNTCPLIVFIHGGAWRTEDKLDYKDLCLEFRKQGISTASINYRLSLKGDNPIQHPDHIIDVGEGIKYLYEHSSGNYSKEKIYLVGHSAGAHIALMLLLDIELPYHHYIKGTIGVSGIYDIPLLLKEFPTYLDFIAQAFGPDASTYHRASPISKSSNLLQDKPIIIAQSNQDELVNNQQANVMFQHLKSMHANVTLNTTITGGHYEVMNFQNLYKLVQQLVST